MSKAVTKNPDIKQPSKGKENHVDLHNPMNVPGFLWPLSIQFQSMKQPFGFKLLQPVIYVEKTAFTTVQPVPGLQHLLHPLETHANT